MTHLNEIVSLLVTAVVGYIGKELYKTVQEQKALKKGVKAMLHDRLYQSARFYIRQGFIDMDGLTNIGLIYEAYHELHGNGTGTDLYNRVRALPIRDE